VIAATFTELPLRVDAPHYASQLCRLLLQRDKLTPEWDGVRAA